MDTKRLASAMSLELVLLYCDLRENLQVRFAICGECVPIGITTFFLAIIGSRYLNTSQLDEQAPKPKNFGETLVEQNRC